MNRINTQPIEKQDLKNTGKTLFVHSIFPTIQGEGPFAGKPAVFVRLAGCNLQCPSCDTDYTSDVKQMDTKEIVKAVSAFKLHSDLVVITGGEPFRQNLIPLLGSLRANGFEAQIETNGTLFYPDEYFADSHLRWATIVCSPKAGRINPNLVHYINAYKYVLSYDAVSSTDGLPLTVLDHPANPVTARPFPLDEWLVQPTVYLQPADTQDEVINKLNLEAAINSCMTFGYTLCLQIHKIIDME